MNIICGTIIILSYLALEYSCHKERKERKVEGWTI